MTQKEKIALFVLIFGIIVLTAAIYSMKIAVGQSELTGKLLINLKEETAVYTETTEFSEGIPTTVTVQAQVRKSECQSCVEQVNLKDCQDLFKICLDVN